MDGYRLDSQGHPLSSDQLGRMVRLDWWVFKSTSRISAGCTLSWSGQLQHLVELRRYCCRMTQPLF